jgi:hypothetical protein
MGILNLKLQLSSCLVDFLLDFMKHTRKCSRYQNNEHKDVSAILFTVYLNLFGEMYGSSVDRVLKNMSAKIMICTYCKMMDFMINFNTTLLRKE